MAATIYLEAEDEITAAVARIRALHGQDAVMVLSRGSRIGTSRINFRLLAREAQAQAVNLVAVSDEPTVRALAVSAGLPAYDAVPDAESALEHFRQQDLPETQRGARLPAEPGAHGTELRAGAGRDPRVAARDPRSRRQEATRTSGRSAADLGGTSPAGAGATLTRSYRPEPTRVLPRLQLPLEDAQRDELPVEAGERAAGRRLPLGMLLLLGLLLLVVVGGLYAAYLFLPTASITLRVDARPLEPVAVAVTADPAVAVADAAGGVIPAERIQLPLSVSGEFPATGVTVRRTTASGIVRFESRNTVSDVPIRAGTAVSTEEGVEFRTTETVTVERADFDSGQPTQVDVGVEAVNPGAGGNVGRNAITVLPDDLAAAQVSVTNPRATSGGQRIEEAAVTQEDYDAALAELMQRLAVERNQRLADPETTPRGLTLYPATARTEVPQASPPAEELVDSQAESFELTLSATASVVAVNEALVEQVVAEQLRGSMSAGQLIVGDRVDVTHVTGRVLGSMISYSATASARVYNEPDREALLEDIRGRTLDEARAILERYGSAEIGIWPEFVDRLPEQAARISLTILPPREEP